MRFCGYVGVASSKLAQCIFYHTQRTGIASPRDAFESGVLNSPPVKSRHRTRDTSKASRRGGYAGEQSDCPWGRTGYRREDRENVLPVRPSLRWAQRPGYILLCWIVEGYRLILPPLLAPFLHRSEIVRGAWECQDRKTARDRVCKLKGFPPRESFRDWLEFPRRRTAHRSRCRRKCPSLFWLSSSSL